MHDLHVKRRFGFRFRNIRIVCGKPDDPTYGRRVSLDGALGLTRRRSRSAVTGYSRLHDMPNIH